MSAPVVDPAPASTAEAPENVSARLLRVAAWLAEGRTRAEVCALTRKRWEVSRRTAQLYVQKLERRLAHEGEKADPIFRLKLSQLQRERLLRLGHRFLRRAEALDAGVLGRVTGLLSAMGRLLDSRDRAADALQRRLDAAEGTPALVRAEADRLRAAAQLMEAKTAPLLDLARSTRTVQREAPGAERKAQSAEGKTRSVEASAPSGSRAVSSPRPFTPIEREILAALHDPVLPAILPAGRNPKPNKHKRRHVFSSMDMLEACAPCAAQGPARPP